MKERTCSKYANVRIILDHDGRGFHKPNIIEGIKVYGELMARPAGFEPVTP